MKVFLARGGAFIRDVTEEARIGAGIRTGPGERLIAAPDEVFEGWGVCFDGEGRVSRFLRPLPPAGWEYDGRTGTFFRAAEKGGIRMDGDKAGMGGS